MTKSPPVESTSAQAIPQRRNRSRQRDQLLAWLQSTDSHPTVQQIHAGLASKMPQLSLGTVYRNLEVLVEEGVVDEVACASGPARYDANITPHQHFTCDRCGRIADVDVPVPRGLTKRLRAVHGLQARRVSISFFGLCTDCEDDSAAKPATTGPR